MINFKSLSIITSVLSITLFLFLIIIPEPIFILFDVEGNKSAYFVSRRAAMLFAGYSVISYFLRNIQPSDIRQVISLGFAVSMFGLSVLGIFEFIRGFVGVGIFFAVSVELFLGASYVTIWLSDRKERAFQGKSIRTGTNYNL